MITSRFVRSFLYSHLFVTPPNIAHDFSGQTIIVTGSNVGLGLEAARKFAQQGCSKLILAVRTVSKGEAAKESIQSSTGRKDDFMEVWPLDMTNTNSIRSFVRRADGLERVDVLLENAGIALTYWAEYEGMEQDIKVNVVSTLLLALLMLPKLRDTAATYGNTPHLEIVTSESHKTTTYSEVNEDDIYAKLADKAHFMEGGNRFDRYAVSKLMQILFVQELVKHMIGGPVITLVTPGLTHTELANRTPSRFEYWAAQVLKLFFARTVEVGARTLIAGACAGPDSHGKYMEDGKNCAPDIMCHEAELEANQRKTYVQTLAYLEQLEPGISKNIATTSE